MPRINLESALFDTLERTLRLPDVDLQPDPALDILSNGDLVGEPEVLQLSSSLIRIAFAVTDPATSEALDFELRIAGSGIRPVSSIDALFEAIDDGLATGALSAITVLQDGTPVFRIRTGAEGYELTSGPVSLVIDGDLPFRLNDIATFSVLLDRAANIDELTNRQRNALFDDLDAYAVDALSLSVEDREILAATVSPTVATLTLNGLTFKLFGTFPDSVGDTLSVLWQLSEQFIQTGTVDLDTIDGLAVSALRILDQAGNLLGAASQPLDDTPLSWTVDGRVFDQVLIDLEGSDWLAADPGASRDALAGLAGDDRLYGGGALDLLAGGSGADSLYGGRGADVLDGGRGNDRLSGGEGDDTLTGGTGLDVFQFRAGAGHDLVEDFVVGDDRLDILGAERLRDLTFTRVGSDVQIDFETSRITVLDITVAELRQVDNFVF
jgi:Ca2+-binding RTX toxin-like protein